MSENLISEILGRLSAISKIPYSAWTSARNSCPLYPIQDQ